MLWWFLTLSGQAQECSGPVSATEIADRMEWASQAFANWEDDKLRHLHYEAARLLPCLSEPISPQIAGDMHRVEALRRLTPDPGGRVDEAAVVRAFRAELTAVSSDPFIEALGPVFPRVVELFESARQPPEELPRFISLDLPSGRQAWVNGSGLTHGAFTAPAVLQVSDCDGDVVWSGYLREGDSVPWSGSGIADFPSCPAIVVEAEPEPEPEEPPPPPPPPPPIEEPEAPKPAFERPTTRFHLAALLAFQRFQQVPLATEEPQLTDSVSWGQGTTLLDHPRPALELVGRGFLKSFPWLGFHADVRIAWLRGEVDGSPIGFAETRTTWEAVVRAPSAIGNDLFWVGARMGLRVDDRREFFGCIDDEGCSWTLEHVWQPALGLGVEIGAEIGRTYLLGSLGGGMFRAVPYVADLEAHVGYNFNRFVYLDVGLGVTYRELPLVEPGTAGRTKGEIEDGLGRISLGVGVSF